MSRRVQKDREGTDRREKRWDDMSVLRKLDRCLERFLSIMDGIAAISVFGIMLLITADVLSRLILNKPFAGTAEIVSSIIIIVCFLEIPYVAVKGAHVRTTMLYDKVGVKGKHVIDIVAALIGVLVYAFIIRASWGNLLNAISIHEAEIAGSVRITTVPGRFSIIFGSVLMILEFINQIIKYTYELVTGKSFAEGGRQNEYRSSSSTFIDSFAGADFLWCSSEHIPDVYQCAQRIPFHGTFFNSDERAKPVGMGRGPAVYVRRYSAVCLDGTSGELIRRQPGFV